MSEGKYVTVGIGASAGGVEALTNLFGRLTAGSGAVFIVVTHLAPDRKSLMREVLSRATAMPVEVARHGAWVEPDHVYVSSPGSVLTMVDGCFVLREGPHDRRVIDTFLSSLAEANGERAIAVILSGAGSDGAMGLKAVREAGGFTFAQGSNGDGPDFSSMPDAAIGTGYVDRALPIDKLADCITQCVARMQGESPAAQPPDSAQIDSAKRAIYEILKQRVGHDFSHYKDKTFLRRVERRMQVWQVDTLNDYVKLLRKNYDESMALFRDLLIGVTAFFRDPAAFERLAELVIPRLFEGKEGDDDVRVWVPACATGEEAYSVAILLRECMDALSAPPRLRIFATDVDEKALAVARLGRYPRSALESISPERLARFFIPDGDGFIVTQEIRERCMFSPHSVFRDPPFSHIDFVSCRNLLIYFKTALQEQVIPLFHYALRPGGFLFLGSAENLTRFRDLFSPIDKRVRIFQRDEQPARRPIMPFTGTHARGRAAVSLPRPRPQEVHDRLERRVLERYTPPHVLINREADVVHFSGRTGKYLEAPAGLPTRNLFALARGRLMLSLRSAVHETWDTGREAVRRRVGIDVEGEAQEVDITVEPLMELDGQAYFVVVFADVGPSPDSDETAPDGGAASGPDDVALTQLEKELSETRLRLQETIEEYETAGEELKSSNEELLSLNEELQSSNEELEASKEELQSVNEEITTVNAALTAKVDELDNASGDLKNLLDITRIATIFLDHDLVIRSFTPAMAGIYKLIPADCGRSLTDIVSLVDYDEIREDVVKVARTGQPLERRVSRRDGAAHYLMRAVSYQTMYDKVNGAILTFLDLTEMVRGEERQRLLVAELNHRVKNILAVVAAMATQMARRSVSVGEFTVDFLDRLHGLAKVYEILSAKEWSPIDLGDLLRSELEAFVLDAARARLSGPPVAVQPRLATTLGIVFHELATNAMKYGALANAQGSLTVDWSLQREEGASLLRLSWREEGGPPVTPPAQRGLGSELIQRSLQLELDGVADIDYRPEGVIATLSIPVTGADIEEGDRV